jgi:hypothetical protein
MSLQLLKRAWDVVWRWLFRRPLPLKTIKVEELPEDLKDKSVYVVGEGNYQWFAAMLCPCGCGETLHMNLLPEGRPRWKVTVHKDGTVTLHPSVWRKKGCRSHFFLIRGLIKWC